MKLWIRLYYSLMALPSQLDRRYLLPFTGYESSSMKSPYYLVADVKVEDGQDKGQITEAAMSIVKQIYNPTFFEKIEVGYYGDSSPIVTLDPRQAEVVST